MKVIFKYKTPFIFAVLLFALSACPRPVEYPVIPEISFKEFILQDTSDALGNSVKKLQLVFHVVDGDGNIGLTEADTAPPFDYNFYATLYEKKNGNISEIATEAPYYYRIPDIEPLGQNKLLTADIYVDMDFSADRYGDFKFDSILYDFYIYDKTLNQSNIERSPAIKLDTVGVFSN